MPVARRPLAAISFLTRIPVAGGGDVASGAVFFPVVGAAIGAGVGAVAYGLAQIVPALAAAGIAVASGAVVTGGLHLDGLADTADALGAGSRERALEVMRDHATGAYGASALVLDLLVKTAGLAALTSGARVVLFATAAGALSRAVPVVLAAALPSVREDGAGAAFRVSASAAAIAALLAAAIAVAADTLLIPVAAGAVVVLGAWFRRWLGGVTGDTLGAAAELSETAVLVAAAALA
jgi:adenosylcobinamide-GDP ribazoletransferase